MSASNTNSGSHVKSRQRVTFPGPRILGPEIRCFRPTADWQFGHHVAEHASCVFTCDDNSAACLKRTRASRGGGYTSRLAGLQHTNSPHFIRWRQRLHWGDPLAPDTSPSPHSLGTERVHGNCHRRTKAVISALFHPHLLPLDSVFTFFAFVLSKWLRRLSLLALAVSIHHGHRTSMRSANVPDSVRLERCSHHLPGRRQCCAAGQEQ